MIKRFFLFLLSFLLFIQGASALSYAFKDVPADSWYADYVLTLNQANIIDSALAFRPEDSVKRAELIKMVIEATGGLEGYTPPAHPTFDDVLPGAWYTNYIEEAATLGIALGYEDAQGNLTGLFGPADTVNRAAAVKMLVEAFDLKATTGEAPPYPDVSENDWFYDYVLIASQNGLVSGYENGFFGPADPVTRAQMSKMVVLGMQTSVLTEEVVPADEEEAVEEPVIEEAEEPLPAVPEATANQTVLAEGNAAAGSGEIFVASYSFRALYEGFMVETVTIANDITGDKLGDQLVGTPVIKNIVVKYPDKDGLLATASAPLGSDGKARFTNLSFYVPRDKDQFFEVYADLNKFSDLGGGVSGEVFRLGLQDINNTDTSFRAVGEFSGTVIGYSGSRLSVTRSQAPLLTVRRSAPSFSLNSGSDTLVTGQNTLISFDVSAETSGSIGLARLSFELSVSDNDGAGLSLSDFKLYRGSTMLSDVTIYDATGAQDLAPGSGGSLANGLSDVIVTFDQEAIVSAGLSQTYSLRATASSSQNNDTIATRLATGDEETPLSGLSAVNQANTGKVYVNGDATSGIFTSANDFAQAPGMARNIIWSDMSADLHLFPTFSAGLITSDSGSHDWTNGYRLGLTGLDFYIISK